MAIVNVKPRHFSARLAVFDPEELVERAQKELRDSPYPALRWLTCRFHEGRLVLQGEVGSFFLKQVAQTMAGRVAGLVQIENRVEVLD